MVKILSIFVAFLENTNLLVLVATNSLCRLQVQVALQGLKTVKIGIVQLALQVPKNQLIIGKKEKSNLKTHIANYLSF
jgi:hypothetical protein